MVLATKLTVAFCKQHLAFVQQFAVIQQLVLHQVVIGTVALNNHHLSLPDAVNCCSKKTYSIQ